MKFSGSLLVGLPLLVLVGSAVCQAAPPSDALTSFRPGETHLGEVEVMVPARRLGDLLVVAARVNGHGPYSFILDTGAGAVFVSNELAADLSNRGKGTPVYTRKKGGDRQIGHEVSIDQLTLGAAEFKKFRALTVDFGDLRAATGERIDGLLGFSLFASSLVTLDFPGSRVLLRSGKLPEPNGEDILPYSVEPGGTPQVILLSGDTPLSAVVDSGQGDALAVPKAKGLAFKNGPTAGPLAASITGRRRREIGRLARAVRLGRYTVDTPAVLDDGQTGKIGAGILKFFAVTFDSANHAVRFARQGEAAIVVPSPRTVGLGFARGKDGWKVVDVIPGSPAAAAGVQLGDLLVAVGGQPVSRFDYNGWQVLLQSESSLSVELRRGETRIQLNLPVGDLVR